MKKINILIIAVVLTLTSFPTIVNANKSDIRNETPANSQENKERAQLLVSRLFEIEKMDKSEMDASSKRIIRKEVKSIDKELKQLRSSGGIYISAGAIIIILILLIILL
jgi:hypothetical protein